MCGIYGCILKRAKSLNYCLKRLQMLEYRGYDSSGISSLAKNEFYIEKSTGYITNLMQKVQNVSGKNVISHTRWATHGKISKLNAHPHKTGNVCIVHNGIIDNYNELLKTFNFKVKSQCDSEVISAIINFQTKKYGYDIFSFIDAVCYLKGSYSFLAQIKQTPNLIFGAKYSSPLYIGKSKNGFIFASDLICFYGLVEEFYELQDGEVFVADCNHIEFYNLYKIKINKEAKELKKHNYQLNKKQFSCFLEKEINDIPYALTKTLQEYNKNNYSLPKLSNYDCIHIIACGTAYHSALAGKHIIEKHLKLPTYCHIASEFLYEEIIENRKALYVFISQSGETFDTLECAKKVREANFDTLAITNNLHSQITKICYYCLPIYAGPEISVASTKVYNCTILAFMFLCQIKVEINNRFLQKLITKNNTLPLTKFMVKVQKIIFIGKQEDYVSSLEASLKFKELTYKNCTALPSGELKHGTLSVVDENCLVVAFLTNIKYTESITASLSEVKTRGGKTALITSEKFNFSLCDFVSDLPLTKNLDKQLYSIIPAQKIALQACNLLKLNPDKPRNLAKSVTVQ